MSGFNFFKAALFSLLVCYSPIAVGEKFIEFLTQMQNQAKEIDVEKAKYLAAKSRLDSVNAKYGTEATLLTQGGGEYAIKEKDKFKRHLSTVTIKKPIFDLQRSYDRDGGKISRDQQALQMRLVEIETLFQNSTLYVDLVTSAEEVQTAKLERDTYEDNYRSTSRRFELGEINSSNVDQVKLTLERKRIDYSIADTNLEGKILELQEILQKISRNSVESMSLPILNLDTQAMSDAKIDQILRRHPSYLKLELAQKQNALDLRHSREYFDPKLYAETFYNFANIDRQVTTDSIFVGLELNMTLYSGNSSFYERQQAMQGHLENKANIDLYLLKATQRIKREIFNIRENLKRQVILDEVMKDSQILVDKTKKLYVEGYANSLELINALTNVYTYRRQLSSNKADIFRSKLLIMRTFGDLTLANLKQRVKE